MVWDSTEDRDALRHAELPSDTEGGSTVCPLCESRGLAVLHEVGEQMVGTKEVFIYSECLDCGSLLLVNPPNDMSPYYPKDYYSFADPPAADTSFKRRVKRFRSLAVLHAPKVSTRLLPPSRRPAWADWFTGVISSLSAPIIDIGCGTGWLLRFLSNDGFTTLVGYDPFLSADTIGDIPLYRAVPHALSKSFALAMMHHSLEHSPDPYLALQEAVNLVAPGGHILVRIPLADSFGWRHYGPHWMGLDPPRHLYAFTERSIRLLAQRVGLTLVRHHRDSSGDVLAGSELLRRGVPLNESILGPGTKKLLAESERADLDARAVRLNAAGEGDTGCFLFRRPAV